MDFFFFLLVNAVLFLRPAELLPALGTTPLYEYAILACAAASLPAVFRLLARPLGAQPITVCVVGLLPVIVLTHLAGRDAGEAGRAGVYFFKVLVYYALFVSVVNTPARLRAFIFWLVCFAAVYTAVNVLQYLGVIDLPTLKAELKDTEYNPQSGEEVYHSRLQASGIFQDPNELCTMLAAVVPLVLYRLTNPDGSVLRVLWAGPLALFLYAITLTQSRGGFLALLGGLGAYLVTCYGWRRAAVLGLAGLPVAFVLAGGRQGDLSAMSGTGQSRVQIWSDWLMEFRYHPLFGKGMLEGTEAKPKEERGRGEHKLVAHNSYLHAFADLGFLGGTLFLGAFVFALWGLGRLGAPRAVILDPGMRRLHPYLVGSVAAFAVGLLSLSFNYMVPTYLILALAMTFLQVTPAWPPAAALRFDGRAVGRLALASVGFLAFTYVFVRLFIRWA